MLEVYITGTVQTQRNAVGGSLTQGPTDKAVKEFPKRLNACAVVS